MMQDWPADCYSSGMRKTDVSRTRREPEDDLLAKLRELVAQDERVAVLDGAAWQLASKLDQLNRQPVSPLENHQPGIIVLPAKR